MDGFMRVADLAREGGADRGLRRSADRGQTIRVARGRFLREAEWAALDFDSQYKAKIYAWVETTRTRQVFSHWSAAALWGYPIIGAWPSRIHVTLDLRSGQRSTRGVARHLADLRENDVVELDGLFVTSPTRTLIDLVRCAGFATGVAACDRALAAAEPHVGDSLHVQREVLLEAADRLAGQRGVRRLRSVAEFDGLAKYTRNRYLKGREVADVVIEEKVREDAMRLASGCRMARWTWSVASDLTQLRRLLVGAGVHPER